MKLYDGLNENAHFLIPVINHDDLEHINSYLNDSKIKYSIEVNAANEFLSLSEFSIVTSGTASLQILCIRSPPNYLLQNIIF